MPEEPLKLYWKDQLIGHVRDAGWSDFPWVCGKVSIINMSPDLREVLEYVHKESISEDGLRDWPYPEEYWEDWRMVKPDGTSREIMLPIIDFETGDIDWR
jgi:hypothetical protein